jgi:hypothetical protein
MIYIVILSGEAKLQINFAKTKRKYKFLHMVGEVGVGDDGAQESLEIPLSDVESRTNQPPKTKIMVAVALWFTKSSVLLWVGAR